MWLESEEGRGSTFHATIRVGTRRPDGDRERGLGAAAAGARRSLRILLAEDNIVNQRVAGAILSVMATS